MEGARFSPARFTSPDSVAGEDQAEVIIDVTALEVVWRRHDQASAVVCETDVATQLRAAGIRVGALMLRLAADVPVRRVAEVLHSLHQAGFERVTLGTPGS